MNANPVPEPQPQFLRAADASILPTVISEIGLRQTPLSWVAASYDSFRKTYNVPELVSKPVPSPWRVLAYAAQGKNGMIKALLDSRIPVDGKTGSTPVAKKLSSEPY
jgi:hypothetical protein